MLRAISGSTMEGLMTMKLSEAKAIVIVWAMVKAVTCKSSGLAFLLNKKRPITNKTWSNPSGRTWTNPFLKKE